MAAGIAFLPPIALIPILWFQEMAASILMARGGWRDAQRLLVVLLVAGSWIGWPLGLTLTGSISVETSKTLALGVILVLSVMQLAKLRIPGLNTNAGALISGIVAGIISGTAHVGGMVVALYVLAQGSAARSMRGTLVLFLFISSVGSLFYQLGFGVMTETSIYRGLALVPFTLIGVVIGTRFFSPKLEPYYKPFCLGLLICLSFVGLVRLVMDGAL